MVIRIFISAFIALALVLGGGSSGATDKQDTVKATKTSQPVKKVDIKIDSIPWSNLERIFRLKQSWNSKKGIYGPGDFWTPEMLQKIRSRKK